MKESFASKRKRLPVTYRFVSHETFNVQDQRRLEAFSLLSLPVKVTSTSWHAL